MLRHLTIMAFCSTMVERPTKEFPLSPTLPELQTRIDTLETRDAYREDTLAQLSELIYRQQKQIDRLEHLLETLEQKVKGLASGESSPLPDNERPPHY